MTAHPVAYLRRSNPDTRNGGGDLSREQQLEAVRRMASEDGHDPDALMILEGDWGKSGRDAKLADRKDWERLVGMVERGEASHVYTYEMSRLGRSVMQTARLATVARDHGVVIRCAVGISPDYSTPEGEMMTNTLANIHQYYGSAASARAQANVASRQARGDDLGPPAFGWQLGPDGKHIPNPEEDVAGVLDAYDRAGSFLGAAKLLTAEGRSQPRRADHWDGSTVARVVRAHRHVGKVEQGVKQRAAWRLFRLLQCPHCGKTLTAQASQATIGYVCKRAVQDPRHPRPYSVSEGKVLPWIKAEAARLQAPERVQLAEQNAARRAELEADRESLGWAVADRHLSREQAQVRADKIEAELQQMATAEDIVEVPQAIDWAWDPAAINTVLRALWEFVQLDGQMQPVEARWRVPAWRA